MDVARCSCFLCCAMPQPHNVPASSLRTQPARWCGRRHAFVTAGRFCPSNGAWQNQMQPKGVTPLFERPSPGTPPQMRQSCLACMHAHVPVHASRGSGPALKGHACAGGLAAGEGMGATGWNLPSPRLTHYHQGRPRGRKNLSPAHSGGHSSHPVSLCSCGVHHQLVHWHGG